MNMFVTGVAKVSENASDISRYTEFFNNIVDTLSNLVTVIIVLAAIVLAVLSIFSINKRSRKFTKKQINALKADGKYIPGIFVELNESKEVLRYFVYGAKWKNRIIADYNFIYNNFYGSILKKANLNQEMRFRLFPWVKMSYIESTIDTAIDYHKKFSKRIIKLADGFSESEPLFEIIYHPYLDALERLQFYIQAASRKYMVLTGSAGNGKTNLLCSIAELALNLNEPTIFVNSRDVKDSVEAYLFDSLNVHRFWRKQKSAYFWLLNLKLKAFGKHLLIIIDAINENNKPDFGERIKSFVNDSEKFDRLKIIVSCRNEYYTERFAKCISTGINQRHFVYDLKTSSYPNAALERIFKRYREHFNYSGFISDSVKYTLCEQLLLLRIFFEVKQDCNEDTLSICKHDLFEAYINKIKDSDSPRIEELLNHISDSMLESMAFDCVDIDKLAGFSGEMLSKALDEAVLLSKKLVLYKDTIARTDKEVVYFVFDELRDYYIARRIMQSHVTEQSIDCSAIINDVKSLRDANAPCEEGVISYTYIFFKTSSAIQTADKICHCKELLSFYKAKKNKTDTFYHRRHRVEFMNYGLKMIFSTGLPLEQFEVEYIQDCLKNSPYEDGGKIFDVMLLGSIVGLDNNLDKYLDIIFGLHDKDMFYNAFKQMIAHPFDDSFNLPTDLIGYHQELVAIHPERAMQIQRIAELFMIIFELKDKGADDELRNYFYSCPEHKKMKAEIADRLYNAVLEG